MTCSNSGNFFQSMKTEFLKDFSNSFLKTNQNNYFIAVGRNIPWSRDDFSEVLTFDDNFYSQFDGSGGLTGDDLEIPTITDTQRNKSSYRLGNVFMKRVKEDNFSFLVPNYTWEKGATYDTYDDAQDLFNPRKKFFVFNRFDNGIYKCLENGGGASSNIEPEESYTEGSFLLEDGHRWKLVYKVENSQQVKFSVDSNDETVDSYIPVKIVDFNYNLSDTEQIQYDIQTSAIPGSIESVYINPEFKNHITFDTQKCIIDQTDACAVFSDGSSGDVEVEIAACGGLTNHPPGGGENYWTDYLKNFVFNVVSGVGSGQRRVITRSKIIDQNTDNPYIILELDSPLDYGISGFSGSTPKSFFTIEPQIKVHGDGTSLTGPNVFGNSNLINADFRPIFKEVEGESTKTLNTIEVVNPGKDYTRIKAEFVSGITHHYPDFTGTTLASKITSFNTNFKDFLRPILPPEGGHGSNPLNELGCDKILFRVDLESDEDGYFNTQNDFRQISLIKNPLLVDPIIQLRFVEPGTNMLEVGNTVFYGGPTGNDSNSGTITKVFNFSDESGNEIFVGGVSGSFDGATSVYIYSEGDDGVTFTVDPFDGFRKYTIAGSENRSSIILEVETTESNTYFPRDILVGLGSSQNSTYSSFASGMIREVKAVANKRIFTLEDVQGTFRVGEKVGVINKPKNDGDSTFRILNNSKVLSYRRSRENYRDSYSVVTKIVLDADGGYNFTNDSFYEDQPIYSFDSDAYVSNTLNENIEAAAHLFAWTVTNSGAKVTLELVGATNRSFKVGHYIPYFYSEGSGIIYGTISSVEEADIRYDSGEIVHTQNFKPIQRSTSSKEELSLILGL